MVLAYEIGLLLRSGYCLVFICLIIWTFLEVLNQEPISFSLTLGEPIDMWKVWMIFSLDVSDEYIYEINDVNFYYVSKKIKASIMNYLWGKLRDIGSQSLTLGLYRRNCQLSVSNGSNHNLYLHILKWVDLHLKEICEEGYQNKSGELWVDWELVLLSDLPSSSYTLICVTSYISHDVWYLVSAL